MKKSLRVITCLLAVLLLLGTVACAPSTEKLDALLQKWEAEGKISYEKTEDATAFLDAIRAKTGAEIGNEIVAAYSVTDNEFNTVWIIEFQEKSDARALRRADLEDFYGTDDPNYKVKRKGATVFLGDEGLIKDILDEA